MPSPSTASPRPTDRLAATARRLAAWWRRLSAQRRRRLLIVGGVALLVVVIVVTTVANAVERARIGNPVDFGDLPASVAGWEGEQIELAATIIDVAQSKGIPTRGQEIAVMVAMGESSLENIDYGDDAINPDGSVNCSLGLFQQQWCIGWGTREEVLDPEYAAGAFLDAMVEVDDWETMEPTLVGHAVQVNEDPYHYEPYFADAQQLVSELTGVEPVA